MNDNPMTALGVLYFVALFAVILTTLGLAINPETLAALFNWFIGLFSQA